MNIRPPTLRLHATGQWFVRWGGRDRYFGKDKSEAEERFLTDRFEGLPAWTEWRTARNALRLPSIRSAISVGDLRTQFIESRRAEGGEDRVAFYKWALKDFVESYRLMRSDSIRAAHLQSVKDVMLAKGLKPKSINHVIQAVRTMFQWAMDLEMVPPVNLRGVKKLPLPPLQDKSWDRKKVHKFILGCSDKSVQAWLAVNYLTAMRPKEVVRAVNGEGRWKSPGILEIPNKSRTRSRMPRLVLFSDEALAWFAKCEAKWTRLDSYSAVVRRTQKAGPHALRHSAASHLYAAGVSREQVDLILGHYPNEVSLTYTQPRWPHLRALCSKLTLK